MQEKTTVVTVSQFGFISGLATTSSFLIPVIALGVAIAIGYDAKIIAPLFFALAAVVRFTGDWVFWTQMFPHEMDSTGIPKNWRSSVKDILLSQPGAIKSMLDMLMDVIADLWLLYIAFKAAVPPAWIVLAFLGSQALAAPIQGIIVDRFDKMKYRLFSMIITALAVVTAIGIGGQTKPAFYTNLLALNNFVISAQILIILCAKTLLTGTTVIAKAIIASSIQAEAKIKFGIRA